MKKTYSELLRDPRWQKKRLEIMERAGWACEECGDAGTTFNVHHKKYRKGAAPWEYEDDELQALCENCHHAEHAVKTALDEIIGEMSIEQREHLLGFAEAYAAIYSRIHGNHRLPEIPFKVRSTTHALGVGQAIGLSPFASRLAIEGHILTYGDIYDRHEEVFQRQHERMRANPEFSAAWDEICKKGAN